MSDHPPDAHLSATFTQATSTTPGAIGLFHIHGAIDETLASIAPDQSVDVTRVRLVRMGDIDTCLLARPHENLLLIMPHAGPRVMQRLRTYLRARGVRPDEHASRDASSHYPEATDRIEALMLATVPALRSEIGLRLLLDQPRRWREATSITRDDLQRSDRLNRLLSPPLVVLAGPANVGKSTLSNQLLGRPMSIEADLPGTTRDFTAAAINLGGLVVNWVDTPGLRVRQDSIEADAVSTARQLASNADLLISMTDHEQPWPDLPRTPDLRIANKSDLAHREDAQLAISARSGTGIDYLVARIRDQLLPPDDLTHPGIWVFDPRLPTVANLTGP